MTLMKPLFIQAALGSTEVDCTAAEARMLAQALASGGGVVAPSARVITAATGWNVNVAAFCGIVPSDVADNGCYFIRSTASTTTAVATGTTTYARTQRVIAQVRDHSVNGSYGANVYDWVLSYVASDGSGNEQAEPVQALTLAHVYFPANATSISQATITQGALARDLLLRGPWVSNQVSPGSWNYASSWHDFTSGQWPAVAFTVPPSGMVWVSVSGSVRPHGTNCCLGWRISGGDTVANTTGDAARLGGSGVSGLMFRWSARTLVTGLTPGASDTVTPGWYTTDVTDSDDGDGQLLVEAV